MHPNTRSRVNYGRQFQLFLRVSGLLGALGLLFCCISINKTSKSAAWMIRVAPAVALPHTVYSIYHLCRAAAGRTPASTASYMVFAAIIDTGLLPFFAFASYLSYLDWSQNRYGWSTLFEDSDMSYKIIFAFFVMNSAEAGIMFFSLLMDIYLATIFRKIAKMPPDMNPLEPNLTSRHGQKHKRNKSSMNVTEKHMSNSTLAAQLESQITGRRVPFIHTRTDSADSVTLYGNEDARNSRISMRKDLDDSHKDPYRLSNNSSRVTLAPTRPTSAINPAEHARTAGAGLDHRPARSSGLANSSSPNRSPNRSPERPSSWLSYMDYEGVPTALSDTASEQLDQDVRPMSPVSALSSRGPSLDQARHDREAWYNTLASNNQARPSTVDLNGNLAAPPNHGQLKKRSREPLGMNPPTPRPEYANYQDENVYTPASYGVLEPSRDVLSPTHANVQRTSRPSSFIGSGGKSRFYGNLRASVGEGKKGPEANVIQVHEDDDAFHDRTQTMQSTMSSDYSGNVEVYASDSDGEDGSNLNVQHLRVHHNQNQYQTQYAPRTTPNVTNVTIYPPTTVSPVRTPTAGRDWGSSRQVSNSTGFDLQGGYAGLGSEFGRGMAARRREVSGKVAEEGRSEVFEDMYRQEETQQEEKKGLGASGKGWARFKGL